VNLVLGFWDIDVKSKRQFLAICEYVRAHNKESNFCYEAACHAASIAIAKKTDYQKATAVLLMYCAVHWFWFLWEHITFSRKQNSTKLTMTSVRTIPSVAVIPDATVPQVRRYWYWYHMTRRYVITRRSETVIWRLGLCSTSRAVLDLSHDHDQS